MALNSYPLGTLVKVTGTFRDPDNADALYDPTSVSIIVTDPQGECEVYVYQTDSEITRQSEGIYVALIPGTSPGTWSGRYNGDSVAYEEGHWIVETARGVVLTGIYADDPPAARTLVVGTQRDDDEADISAPIRMKPGEKYAWRISFERTQLAVGDVLNGMSAPTVGGAEAANCTIHASEGVGWGIDPKQPTSVLIEPSIDAGAASDDEIYIDVSVAPEAGDTFTVRIPVEIDG